MLSMIYLAETVPHGPGDALIRSTLSKCEVPAAQVVP
jgi:hypothetical protein